MSTAVAPLLLAAAIGVWPSGLGRRRLRALYPPARAAPGRVRLPAAAVSVPVTAGLVAWPLLGPAGAVAGLMLAFLVRRAIGGRRAGRAALTAVDGLAEALRALVAELRAGASPVAAAESAAEDAPPTVATALRSAAAAARLGGQAEYPLSGTEFDAAGARIGRAWQLAAQHGLPLADVLDAVRVDLEQRVRFARQVEARMAGPRASTTVLACLPAVAVLLGQGSGAGPLAVLAGSGVGQLLLLVGSALIGAGLLWSEHITRPHLFR